MTPSPFRTARRAATGLAGSLIVGFLFCAGLLPAQEHWSFQPVRAVRPPVVRDDGWCGTDVDRFVYAGLSRVGLSPSPPADRRALVRRVHLVALGLPPTPQEVEQFVTDSRADAYERLIDRVLASERCGERWASFWLDLVHFAETTGFETNVPRPDAWPYRDYVIAAFNRDTPYPQFIREQLAGDACGMDAATGFLVAGPYDEVKSPDPGLTAMQRHEELRDIVNTTSTAFLGLTVACATCHDHKFDPITQRDFYAWKAIFAGVRHGSRPLRLGDDATRHTEIARLQAALAEAQLALDAFEPLARENSAARRRAVTALRNVDRFAPVTARFVRLVVLATNSAEPCIDEFEIWSAGPDARNVALASAGGKANASSLLPGHAIHQIEHLNDGFVGNDHSWISNESGRGWIEVELPHSVVIDRVVWGRDRDGRYQDRVATSYRIEVATEPGAFQEVASAVDREPFGSDPPIAGELSGPQAEVRDLLAQLARWTPRQVYAGTFVPPPAIHLLERGDPLAEREPIAPGAIAALQPPLDLSSDTPEVERRLALAVWLGSEHNPLTARVMVNRIWQVVFGDGLVSTPSDFGKMGTPPTNPALLDHLAMRFMREGWSVKSLQRTLMLSSTFRQDSRPRLEAAQLDAGNRLLWRFAPHRLDAEAIRDAILLAAGSLDLTAGGAGFSSFVPNDNYVHVYEPKSTFDASDWRRMVYQTKVRMVAEPVFGVFDCPDAGQVAPRRQRSTTPLQALSLFNSGFVVEQAQRFAARIARETGDDTSLQIHRGFELAFGRAPTAHEAAAAARLIDQHGPSQFCRALLNANEFVFVQ